MIKTLISITGWVGSGKLQLLFKHKNKKNLTTKIKRYCNLGLFNFKNTFIYCSVF